MGVAGDAIDRGIRIAVDRPQHAGSDVAARGTEKTNAARDLAAFTSV